MTEQDIPNLLTFMLRAKETERRDRQDIPNLLTFMLRAKETERCDGTGHWSRKGKLRH